MAQRLREVEGDNCEACKLPTQKLVEVTDAGKKTQMTTEQLQELKDRQDIRIKEDGDKATVLHKLNG